MMLIDILEKNRDALLIAEITALIHDLGKLSGEFIGQHSHPPKELAFRHDAILLRPERGTYYGDNFVTKKKPAVQIPLNIIQTAIEETRKLYPGWKTDPNAFGEKPIDNIIDKVIHSLGATIQPEIIEGLSSLCRRYGFTPTDFLPDRLVDMLDEPFPVQLQLPPPFDQPDISLGDAIELHHRKGNVRTPDDVALENAPMPDVCKRLANCDGSDSAADKGNVPERGKSADLARQQFENTCISTAFGYECDKIISPLKEHRHQFGEFLAALFEQIVTTDGLSREGWYQTLYKCGLLLFSIDPKCKNDLNTGRGISEELRQQFESHKIPLSQNVTLQEKDRKWLITDEDNQQTYAVKKECDKLNVYSAFRSQARRFMSMALGETRRAANDVTLWAHGYSTATLFKSLLAQIIIEKAIVDNSKYPMLDQKQLEGKWNSRSPNWRLLRVNIDCLGLISKANKIGDILGYQDQIKEMLDAVKRVVEVDYPLGNEVYRDESGIYFTFPNLEPQNQVLTEIRARVFDLKAVRQFDVEPVVELSESPGRTLTLIGKEIDKGYDVVNSSQGRYPEWVASWQRDDENFYQSYINSEYCEKQCAEGCHLYPERPGNPEKHQVERCPVCQIRPKCEHQEICKHCEEERKSRMQQWMLNPAHTIWLGELADTNGRIAIITGQFEMSKWLNGNLVESMRIQYPPHDPDDYPNYLEAKKFGWTQQRELTPSELQDRDFRGRLKMFSINLDKFRNDLDNNSVISESLRQELKTNGISLSQNAKIFIKKARDSWLITDEDTKQAYSVKREAQDLYIYPWEQEFVLSNCKYPSPGRMRRIWETTQRFWEETVAGEILLNHDYHDDKDMRYQRLALQPTCLLASIKEGTELEVQGVRLSTFFDTPNNRFLVTENLNWLAKQLGVSSEELVQSPFNVKVHPPNEDKDDEAKTGEQLAHQIPMIAQKCEDRYRSYKPYMVIHTSPLSFIAFVPCADATRIIQAIRSEYETQFSKVANRLPLNMGAIYFRRKFPLYMALDAARRMMRQFRKPAPSETWEITNNPADDEDNQVVTLHLKKEGDALTRSIQVSYHLLDDKIDWYHPYFFVVSPPPDELEQDPDRPSYMPKAERFDYPLVHVKELKQGDKVQLMPSYFDVEFVDSADNRFLLSYDDTDGTRRHHWANALAGTRPYYLYELDRLKKIWELLSQRGLKQNQIKIISETLAEKLTVWNLTWKTASEKEVFKKFAENLLKTSDKQWWGSLSECEQTMLVKASQNGMLFDALDLFQHIMKEEVQEGDDV